MLNAQPAAQRLGCNNNMQLFHFIYCINQYRGIINLKPYYKYCYTAYFVSPSFPLSSVNSINN